MDVITNSVVLLRILQTIAFIILFFPFTFKVEATEERMAEALLVPTEVLL